MIISCECWGLAMAKKQLLVTIEKQTQGEDVAHYAVIMGDKILQMGSCGTESLMDQTGKELFFALFSPLTHVERMNLNVANKDVIGFTAKREIDKKSIFTKEPYHLVYQTLNFAGLQATANVIAMPKAELDFFHRHLPIYQRPIRQLAAIEISIASLVGEITSEPVIVFWARASVLIGLLVENSSVLVRQFDMVEEVGGFSVQEKFAKYIEKQKKNLELAAQKHLQRSVNLRLFTGDLLLSEAGIEDIDDTYPARLFPVQGIDEKNSTILEKKITALFMPVTSTVPARSILQFPELFGLPFVAEELNMMRPEYQQQLKVQSIAKPIGLVASILAGLLLAYTGVMHLTNGVKQSDIEQRLATLDSQIQSLEQRIPNQQRLEDLRLAVLFSEETSSLIRVDRFLVWLSHSVPEGVEVYYLHIMNDPETHLYKADLKAKMSGSYELTKGLSAQLVNSLGERVKLSESQFSYTPAKKHKSDEESDDNTVEGHADFITMLSINGVNF